MPESAADCGPASSTSGWTMFMRPLNAVGLPKNMNSAPGFSLPYIHLMPLKKTISMSPLPSETHTLILLIMLNLGASEVPGSIAPLAPYRSVLVTFARIWRYAMSGLASHILVMEVLSIYLNGYSLRRSPTVSTASSFRRSSALLGPTPGRN